MCTEADSCAVKHTTSPVPPVHVSCPMSNCPLAQMQGPRKARFGSGTLPRLSSSERNGEAAHPTPASPAYRLSNSTGCPRLPHGCYRGLPRKLGWWKWRADATVDWNVIYQQPFSFAFAAHPLACKLQHHSKADDSP